MRAPFDGTRSLMRNARSGGARGKLLVFLVLVVGGVAVLPYVVAKTPLRNSLLAKAVPGGAVRVSATDASLSWISGPSLSGVAVVDSAGAPLMAAEQISLDRAPINLLLNAGDLGAVTIARPTIYVKVRPDGSNLEDAITAITKSLTPAAAATPDGGTAATPTLTVNVVEGVVLIDDAAAGRQWRIEGVNIQLDNRGTSGMLSRAVLTGRVLEAANAGVPVSGASGRFSISLQPANDGRNQFLLQAEGLSLAIAEPWLRRFANAAAVSGTLSGEGSAVWSSPVAGGLPVDFTTSGTLAIDRLDATAPSLKGDHIHLARLELPWRIASQARASSQSDRGVWSIEDLRLRCDVGEIAVRGVLDANLSAARHSLETRGAVDLARLAAMLPHALRVREGTSITSGAVELAGQYRPNETGQIITASVRATQLGATNAGEPVKWDQPINASFTIRRMPGGLQLDALHCDSQFLKLDAAGNAQQLAASASFDLNKLAEQLGQFFDLSGMKLAGTGSAKLAWQRSDANQFNATATGDMSQLAVSLGEGGAWMEPQLAIRAEAAGAIDPASHRPTRVDTARLQVNGQGDVLDARLTSPVSLTADAPTWPLTIKMTGRIAQWLTRARPWFAAEPWQIDGESDLSAVVNVASNAVDVMKAEITVTDLRATAPGWNIHEPIVKFAGDARWNGTTNEVTANAAQLVTSTVSLATQSVHYLAGNAGIEQLTGAAAFRADLARLAAWRAPANQPAPYEARGELTGNVRIAQQGDQITAELNTTGRNLALASLDSASRGVAAPGYQTIWQDPNLNVRGIANYQRSADRMSFDQLQIQSNTLQATSTGRIDKMLTAAEVNATGTLNYDLAQVTPLLRPYLGDGIELVGKEQARFAVAGKLAEERGSQAQLVSLTPKDPYRVNEPTLSPLPQGKGIHWSRRVRAQLELPWSGANVYGLPVGPGRLAAALGDGAMRVEPLSLAVGEGTLTAAPQVRLDPAPAELALPPGPLLTNVRISPEVSEAMLKYVAPVLAGATRSEGQFSMHLDGTRVPLADAKKADIAGKLNVHSVRVVPGAMANQLVEVARQIEALAKRRDPASLATRPPVTLLNIRDQQVNFKVIQGRVHHQNLEFQVNDITLRSQGSVGFDQSVQLTLQVPIQDAWVAKEPLLAGFKGQSLQIPVGGTLTRPQIDARAVGSLSQQLLQGAAQQAVGGELNKALDKIFKSR